MIWRLQRFFFLHAYAILLDIFVLQKNRNRIEIKIENESNRIESNWFQFNWTKLNWAKQWTTHMPPFGLVARKLACTNVIVRKPQRSINYINKLQLTHWFQPIYRHANWQIGQLIEYTLVNVSSRSFTTLCWHFETHFIRPHRSFLEFITMENPFYRRT